MDIVEEFVHNFHQLVGVTIGERQRNLYLLLHAFQKSNLSTEERVRLNNSLIPKNKLEESFKLIVFISLKDTSYLFDVLESENLYLVGKLVKQKWFFDEPFYGITGENLLIDIFPKVSFIVRNKIINKLSYYLKKETLAEEYFSIIENKFGLQEAAKLLPVCSSSFAIAIIRKYNLRLKDRQLLQIIRKDHAFVELYFKECTKSTSHKSFVNDYKMVLKYLAANNFALFLIIFDEYKVSIKLNKSLTQRIFNAKKQEIIARPLDYLISLNVKKVVSLLGDDFLDLYANSFPNDISEYLYAFNNYGANKNYSESGRLKTLIEHLKPEDQYEMLTKTFLKVYKVEITCYPQFMIESLIQIMPKTEKEKWIEIKSKEDRWICYFETEKSIPLIKEKLKLYSDIGNRTTYLEYLIETCRINDDKVALAEVLKYFTERHRNEEVSCRSGFLIKLDSSFKLQKLGTEHWIEINKLLDIIKLNGEHFYEMKSFLEKHVICLFLRNDPYDHVLLELLKKCMDYSFHINMFNEYPQLEKNMLLRCSELVLTAFGEEDLLKACIGFLHGIKDWNRRHKHTSIDPYLYPEIITTMINECNKKKEKDYMYATALHYLVTQKGPSEVKELLYAEFWAILKDSYYDTSIFDTILKIDPQQIVLHIEDFPTCKPFMHSFWRASKLYSHLDIPEYFLKRSLEIVQDEKNENGPRCVEILTHLMPADIFIEWITPFYPTEPKIPEGEDKIKYQIQKGIMEGLKNIDRISLAIPALLKFCMGDYLHSVLGSVYYAACYTPEYKINDFLHELMGRAVSARKHALFLIVNTCDSQRVYNVLKEAGAKEKNSSLCKFILKRSFKYFCKNPFPRFWELLKINAKIINKGDEEAHQYFLDWPRVPLHYLPRFIEFAWENLEQSTLERVKDQRFALLNQVTDENISLFSEMFCKKVLSENLFVDDTKSNIYAFCCLYLLSGNSIERLQFIFALLEENISSKWNVSFSNKYRMCVLSFAREVCQNAVKKGKSDFLNQFATCWYKIVDVTAAFEEHLLLQFALLYLKADADNKIKNYAQEISELYNKIVATYGSGIIEMFADAANSYIFTYMCDLDGTLQDHTFEFINGLSSADKSAHTQILILKLLPKKYSLSQEIVMQHKLLLNESNKSEDLLVKVCYNHYVKNLYEQDL